MSLALPLLACPSGAYEHWQDRAAKEETEGLERRDELEPGCAQGIEREESADHDCAIIANGLCFDTVEAACACDGCATDRCAIAESFPPQAFCQPQDGSTGDGDRPVSSDGACAQSDSGAGECPPADSASDSNSDDDPAGGGSTGSPGCGDSSNCSGGGSQPSSSATLSEVCAVGVELGSSAAERCAIVANGLCFDTTEEACACAGCTIDQCAIAESFPPQAFCQLQDGSTDGGDQPASDDNDSDPDSGGSSGFPGCDDSSDCTGGGSQPSSGDAS
jgi:hypothetical protein